MTSSLELLKAEELKECPFNKIRDNRKNLSVMNDVEFIRYRRMAMSTRRCPGAGEFVSELGRFTKNGYLIIVAAYQCSRCRNYFFSSTEILL